MGDPAPAYIDERRRLHRSQRPDRRYRPSVKSQRSALEVTILGPDEVFEAAGVVPVTLSGSSTRLVPITQLEAILAVCASHSIGVLGIEGFEQDPTGFTPRMDAILDLSEQESAEQSIEDARRFLAEFADSGLVIEIEFAD